LLSYNREVTEKSDKERNLWYSEVTTLPQAKGETLCHGYGNTGSLSPSTDGGILFQARRNSDGDSVQVKPEDGLQVGKSLRMDIGELERQKPPSPQPSETAHRGRADIDSELHPAEWTKRLAVGLSAVTGEWVHPPLREFQACSQPVVWKAKKETEVEEETLEDMGILYHRIRIATPRHNGKVERQHRTDGERFYDKMRMYNLADGRKQLAAYQAKSNTYIKTCLSFRSPNQVLADYLAVM